MWSAMGRRAESTSRASGDAAEAIPISPSDGFEKAATQIGLGRALGGAIDLNQAQYESLHDRRELDLPYAPSSEFVIDRVGSRSGRGAYFHHRDACVATFARRGGVVRSLRCVVAKPEREIFRARFPEVHG